MPEMYAYIPKSKPYDKPCTFNDLMNLKNSDLVPKLCLNNNPDL